MTTDHERIVMRHVCDCYAYITHKGLVLADSDLDTTERAWQVGLGWPDESEISAAKRKGCRVAKVSIYEHDA